jgi:hypothetical protein
MQMVQVSLRLHLPLEPGANVQPYAGSGRRAFFLNM